MAWADGRGLQNGRGDPDIYMAATALGCAVAPIVLVGAVAVPDSVVVTWAATDGTPAELFRREGTGPYVDLGLVTADVQGRIVYVDKPVTIGQTYS